MNEIVVLNSLDQTKNITNYIISNLNTPEQCLPFDEKINICAYIINNTSKILPQIDLFLQEECQVTLLKWLWLHRNKITPNHFDYTNMFNLTFNIIIIFETFPFQMETLINCHFVPKLKEIYLRFKPHSCSLAIRIKSLILYWKKQIKEYKKKEIKNEFLGRKVIRDKMKEESEDESLETQCTATYRCVDKKKEGKKSVKWKRDFVEIIEIQKFLMNDVEYEIFK